MCIRVRDEGEVEIDDYLTRVISVCSLPFFYVPLLLSINGVHDTGSIHCLFL